VWWLKLQEDPDKRKFSYRVIKIIMWEGSSENMQARRQWSKIFKVLKKNASPI
jgi:hypothetical protein